MHHFTCPRWFTERGGWTAPDAPALFAAYTRTVAILGRAPGTQEAAARWRGLREDQFLAPAAGDDFIGVQAYTRPWSARMARPSRARTSAGR